MSDVVDWLSHQGGGIHTYRELQKELAALADDDHEQTCACRLLALVAEAFALEYEDRPLTVPVANRALRAMKDLVAEGINSSALPPQERLDVLNRIARATLI